MAKHQLLLTVDVPEDELSDLKKQLQNFFGEGTLVEDYRPDHAGKLLATHDAYGNPYNKGSAHSSTHDAYGNPYEK